VAEPGAGDRNIEADWLNGEIVLLGRLHGVPTPVKRAAATRGETGWPATASPPDPFPPRSSLPRFCKVARGHDGSSALQCETRAGRRRAGAS